MVPGGTSRIRSLAVLPWQRDVPPGSPLRAFQCLWWTSGARLSALAAARMMTEPPSPPSPPSGPPLGTYFSRRKLLIPRPPSPAFTKISTRSTNTSHLARELHAGDFLAAQPNDQAVFQFDHRLGVGQLGSVRPDADSSLGHLLPGLVIAFAEADGHQQLQEAHLIRSRFG